MTTSRRNPLDALLDAVVYAPIGAFFHGPEVMSELAERGRADVSNARVLGTMAITRGRVEADQLRHNASERASDLLVAVARAAGAPLAGADRGEETAPRAGPQPTHTHDGGASTPDLRVVPDSAPNVDDLPIPDYDNLSASQVVPRLADLAEDELDQVRAYEATHRGRMTILSRIAQLRAS